MRHPAASRHKWIGASVSTRTKAGHLHKVAVFVMILGYSRTKYIEFVNRCDLRSMERCMLNAFLYFGGVPKEVLTDNMKTVVAGREAGKVIWNTQFSDFAVEMGFLRQRSVRSGSRRLRGK